MSKDRVAELTKQLREAAKLQDPIAKSAVELVKLMADNAKESLVVTTGDDMLRKQGEARSYQKLYKDLTTEPTHITSGATING